jgi:hypothetical protein
MSEHQAATTRGFSRALGPFLVLFGAAVGLRSGEMGMLATGFFGNGPLVLVTGAFTLALGCAMLAAHHHWSSLAATIVTVFGIVTALRGAVLLFAPDWLAPAADHLTALPTIILIPAVVAIVVGAYLCFAGWFSGKQTP